MSQAAAAETRTAEGQAHGLDETELARRAAAGDGDAFAALYDRHERDTYNFCFRLTGSADDAADATQEAFVSVLERLPDLDGRDLNFAAYVLTTARHACYRMSERRKRAEPTDELPEAAPALVGAGGGGGLGVPDPGDPGDDPERSVLLEAQQDEIREANARLPERQREALALRELQELSYDEIAEIMDMNRNSVAQLISRARISLRDELRGSALAAIAVRSPDCERALPLIAMRQDGQLKDGADREWLESHLADCDTCGVSLEAMEEAGVSYRAWTPLVPLLWLRKETIAMAGERTGHDWSEVARKPRQGDGTPAAGSGAGAGASNGSASAAAETASNGGVASGAISRTELARHILRRGALVMALAAALLLVFVGLVLGDGAGDVTHVPKLRLLDAGTSATAISTSGAAASPRAAKSGDSGAPAGGPGGPLDANGAQGGSGDNASYSGSGGGSGGSGGSSGGSREDGSGGGDHSNSGGGGGTTGGGGTIGGPPPADTPPSSTPPSSTPPSSTPPSSVPPTGGCSTCPPGSTGGTGGRDGTGGGSTRSPR